MVPADKTDGPPHSEERHRVVFLSKDQGCCFYDHGMGLWDEGRIRDTRVGGGGGLYRT